MPMHHEPHLPVEAFPKRAEVQQQRRVHHHQHHDQHRREPSQRPSPPAGHPPKHRQRHRQHRRAHILPRDRHRHRRTEQRRASRSGLSPEKERRQKSPRHPGQQHRILLHVMRQLEKLMMQQQRAARGQTRRPPAPHERQQRQRHHRRRHTSRRHPAPGLDDTLLGQLHPAHRHRRLRRRQQQHRVMKIPLARHHLPHLFRLIRMIEIRELVVPRIQRQRRREKCDRPQHQPAHFTHRRAAHREKHWPPLPNPPTAISGSS